MYDGYYRHHIVWCPNYIVSFLQMIHKTLTSRPVNISGGFIHYEGIMTREQALKELQSKVEQTKLLLDNTYSQITVSDESLISTEAIIFVINSMNAWNKDLENALTALWVRRCF